ncbi:fructosamine kinase family protein [Frigoribacterium sp. PvP032]|uniref:fructosamine kinase family protein n=1 Tax=Frigoribacterium sp. PvP032 TaxID=2806589 RepID=UPI001AE91C8C|nr:fructosamine kinase family protein [Frigoribacterium sp. PvP032]MBP1190320.1 fructosamine-3-kinase [Frigoribacterium sp. PvP032]
MTPHVKQRADAPEHFFEAEAAGLAWLAEATPLGGAVIVAVESVSPGRIALETVRETRPTPETARQFGAALAVTHAAGADAFGAPPTGWQGPVFIGRRQQECTPRASWGEFYAAQRVLPFARTALEAGSLTRDELDLVERACDLVAGGALDDDQPPARLHGDLWSGNVLFGADGVVLIDPAAHGGHPETDLAMLQLFGLPWLEEALAGYQDAAPLRDGWRDRVPLHQLHPLAVHAAGHGRSYGRALAEAAAQVLRLV